MDLFPLYSIYAVALLIALLVGQRRSGAANGPTT